MSTEPVPTIILFHYHYSPYAHKITWYLQLRKIPYKQCLQPPIMPRPDLTSLGIKYRRIPLLSIGNEVFCDTALIVRVLEEKFPKGVLGEGAQGWEEWEAWSDQIFPYAAALIPSDLPLMKDERFVKDREDYSGRSYKKEDVDAGRERALEKVRGFYARTEKVLSDGRDWILGDKMTLADIEAIWPLEWLTTLSGALDSTVATDTYPKTFSWIKRFTALLPAPKSFKIPTIKGAEAKVIILDHGQVSTYSTADIGVPDNDPSGVTFGEEVEVTPIDTGKNHPQRGRVRALGKDRIIIEVTPTEAYVGGSSLRVVFPKKGFQVKSVSAKGNARL
ncbi:hypothetical protein L873DRAFT_1798295 [Choiromyces venosus 120613-1]|uniref:GST N-terminal domain-containing protein n=1 Tax=Choiromyces venosus 120613-1 TaxID=1336337 RepID=A0A3N4K4J6_9PEZI|nr:hypothetical protein L873DRAFT_1798295 [Choiromyces venosus 120613-1]